MMTSVWVVLLCGISVAALTPSVESDLSYFKMIGKAVSWVAERDLSGCSFTILATRERFSSEVGRYISRLLAQKHFPYQMSNIMSGGPEEGDIQWRVTTCDVFIFIAEDLLTLSHLLDRDDNSWNWNGRYLFISLNSREELEVLSGWYKLQKTRDVVFFIQGHSKQELALLTHVLYQKEKLKFLALWRDGAPVTQVDVFPDKLRDLEGQRLRVFTFNHAPSVFSDVDSQGFLHNVSGIDIEVVKAIGQAMNFIPVFEHPGPARWGTILPNGTYTGMVGRVSRDEAEIGIGNVFVTEVRSRYITFTIPYDYERACFITPSPRDLPMWMAVLFPFSLNVWILLIVTIAGLATFVPIFGHGLMRRDLDVFHNTSSSFLLIIGEFCNQTVVQPQRFAMQVLFGFIMICGFVVTVFYSTNLTAYMLVRAVEPPYTSIQQIVEGDFEVGGFSDFWRAIFDGSANENVRKLGEKFFSFFPDITPHLKRVVSREVVLLENTQHLEYLKTTFFTNREGESPLRLMLEECINPFGIGALLRRNSPLKPSVDMAILHMREGGLVDKFFDRVLQEDHKSDHEGADIGYDPETEDTSSEVQSLTLQHVQGAFLLLGVGFSFALLLFSSEILFLSCGCSKRPPQSEDAE